METPRFFTVMEVAKMFRVTPQAITHRIRTGQMKAVKEGRKWLIPDSEVYDRITE